jgi:Glycosyl hydrolase catalytic core
MSPNVERGMSVACRDSGMLHLRTAQLKESPSPRFAARLFLAVVAALLAVTLVRPGGADAASPGGEFYGASAVSATAGDFALMGQARLGTYRMLLSWNAVQQSPNGPYNWSLPDSEIESAARNGIRPFPFVYGSPSFAAAEPEALPLGSEAARQGWQRFVSAVVERYGPNGQFWALNPSVPYRPVTAVQIWNEQNAAHYTRNPSPRQYAELLKLSQAAIDRVDDSIQIVLGGMFGYPKLAASIPISKFLKKMYRVRGIKKTFDVGSVHPYSGTLKKMTGQIKLARNAMKKGRDRKAPLWITEIGWASDGPEGWPIVVGEAGQAERLRKAFKLLKKKRRKYRIQRVIWFAWRDFELDVCGWCGGAGLVDLAGNPKPSLHEFRRFTGAP